MQASIHGIVTRLLLAPKAPCCGRIFPVWYVHLRDTSTYGHSSWTPTGRATHSCTAPPATGVDCASRQGALTNAYQLSNLCPSCTSRRCNVLGNPECRVCNIEAPDLHRS
jgi:hypothetical protein